MRKFRVTQRTVQKANLIIKSKSSKSAGQEADSSEGIQVRSFVPQYRQPIFEYDREKTEAAWSQALVNQTQRP